MPESKDEATVATLAVMKGIQNASDETMELMKTVVKALKDVNAFVAEQNAILSENPNKKPPSSTNRP